MKIFALVLASFLVPALAAPTPDSLIARGGEPQIHCEPPLVLEHDKCVPAPPKPMPPPPPPAPKPEDCPKGMRYDPSTKKCYNPAAHPSYDNCAYLGKDYDEHKKCCVDKKPEPPKPITCPEHMRYNPSTMKCYNPAKHPSYDNCKWLGKDYDEHKQCCVDKKPEPPKPMPPAPKPKPEEKPHCENKDEYYNEWAKKCLPIKKPEPAPTPKPHPPAPKPQPPVPKPQPPAPKPKPHCENPNEYFDEKAWKCVPKSKPTPPKPVPSPKPHCENPHEYYDEHAKKCLPKWKPEPVPIPVKCPEHMRYNPSTKKCYNPAKHPSVDNCKYLGKAYDEHKKICVDKHPEPVPVKCPEHMRYNPSTKKCYNPAAHPSYDNCKWLGKDYDEHKKCCVDKH